MRLRKRLRAFGNPLRFELRNEPRRLSPNPAAPSNKLGQPYEKPASPRPSRGTSGAVEWSFQRFIRLPASQLPSFPALGLRERALAAFIIIQYSIGPPHIPPAMIISLDSHAGMGCFAFRIKDYEIRNGNVSLDNQLLGESLSQSRRKVRVELVGQGAAVPVSHL